MKKFKSCSVDGCDRKHRAKGLCGYHYAKQFSSKPLPPREYLTRERAVDLLAYDPITGSVRWKEYHPRRKMDIDAGFISETTGYRYVGIDRRHWAVHRLAWLIVYGNMPTVDIDHINGNKLDNRICNLRIASRSENMQNFKDAHADAKIPYLGVWLKRKKYCAEITVNGKKKRLGVYATPEEAHAAYLAAKSQLHPRAPA